MSHQIIEPCCRISFWTETSATDESGRWTRCKVSGRGGNTSTELEFDRSDEGQRMYRAVVRLMRDAYERGKLDAKAEVRKTLGLD